MRLQKEPYGKNWGIAVTPPEKRIDPNKTYRTRAGKRVIGLEIKMENSCGNEVTCPVKGSIVEKEKPFKTRYAIWTIGGKPGIFQPGVWTHPDDLIPER